MRPNSANQAYFEKAEEAFRALFEAARSKHELHFALSLMPEMRGTQAPGWNTAIETQRVLEEYINFLERLEKGRMKLRVALAFYCHIAEASGFYEVPKNMLRIAGGQGHILSPFQDLAPVHKQTGDRIAPNANKVLKDLVGHAQTLGFENLAEVFRDAFDPDIRNGYSHADYIVWDDGLRLPKRNGGYARQISWPDFNSTFNRGIQFFVILAQVISEYVQSYESPKTIRARLNDEPEGEWIICSNSQTGVLSIKNGIQK